MHEQPPNQPGARKGSLDPKCLKPGRAVQLLNSTPLGTVVRSQTFHQRRLEAGMGVAARNGAEPDKVDLFRYVAWRFDRVHAEGAAGNEGAADAGEGGLSGYEAQLQRSRLRNEQMSRIGRDIGPLPPVADPSRRAAAARSFRLFCESYLSATFVHPWSPDHLKAISKIEGAVLEGGLFALAMPRGSGKSSLIEAAAVWALLFGHRRFVVCIAADERLAGDMLVNIQNQLEGHELLLADFPEVCFPLCAMSRARQKAKGQLCMGKPTKVEWGSDGLTLPTIEGSKASGSLVRVAGITGRIRGLKSTRADATSVRPDLVLVDDPQTDESAGSVKQCRDRESTLINAINGLAGPGMPIAGLMACTVIKPGDLADRMLDPAMHPQWQGERCRLVESFPEKQDLWDRYAQLRKDSFASGLSRDEVTRACNDFYLANRAAMDKGGLVNWEHRKLPLDISALQHAMNLRIDSGEEAFFAEFQNDPAAGLAGAEDGILHTDLLSKLNGVGKGIVPHGAEVLTAFIDVQGKALFYMVVAWVGNMTGCIVDYGCEPEQPMRYFALREIQQRTLQTAAPGTGLEAAVYAGLDRLTVRLLGKAWPCDGNDQTMRIEKCLIDSGWGQSTDLVYEFCSKSPHAAVLMPSKGVGIAPGKTPLNEWNHSPGDRAGLNWRVRAMPGRRQCRHVLYDANFWKSCIAARIKTARQDPGSLYLFGREGEVHRLLLDHLSSEHPTLITANGRTVTQWDPISNGRDNHWWDCLVGSAVAANMLRVTPPGLPPPKERRKVSFSQMAADAQRRQ
jgi:hypothetical protein